MGEEIFRIVVRNVEEVRGTYNSVVFWSIDSMIQSWTGTDMSSATRRTPEVTVTYH